MIADGSLYLKVDQQTRALFERQGSHAFSYFKKGKECRLSYFLAAEDFFEDSDACIRWAGLAHDAARSGKKQIPEPLIQRLPLQADCAIGNMHCHIRGGHHVQIYPGHRQ